MDRARIYQDSQRYFGSLAGDYVRYLSVLIPLATVFHLSGIWARLCCMAANRLVQARQHLLRSTPAGISLFSKTCKVTQQRRRIRLSPSQAGKLSDISKRDTHTTLQSHSTAEATELCKLHLQQQLVGVNRGIFGVKVRRLKSIFRCEVCCC